MVSEDFLKVGPRGSGSFELKQLIGAIQGGHFDAGSVRTYLSLYKHDKKTLENHLNAEVDGYPAMFYIVSTNNIGIIREWIKHGVNPNSTRVSDGWFSPNCFLHPERRKDYE